MVTGMDLNHRSPGYEPDGISRLPTSLCQAPALPIFKPPLVKIRYSMTNIGIFGIYLSTKSYYDATWRALIAWQC